MLRHVFPVVAIAAIVAGCVQDASMPGQDKPQAPLESLPENHDSTGQPTSEGGPIPFFLQECRKFSAFIHKPMGASASYDEAPPEWRPQALSLYTPSLAFYVCSDLETGPFARGPFIIGFDESNAIELPSSCEGTLAADIEKMTQWVIVNDEEVAKWLEGYGVPVRFGGLTMSTNPGPGGTLEEVSFTWTDEVDNRLTFAGSPPDPGEASQQPTSLHAWFDAGTNTTGAFLWKGGFAGNQESIPLSDAVLAPSYLVARESMGPISSHTAEYGKVSDYSGSLYHGGDLTCASW